MESLLRLRRTALLVFRLIFRPTCSSRYAHEESHNNLSLEEHGYIEIQLKKIPLFLKDPAYTTDPNGTMGFFIPLVFPLAAPFILFRLKRTGFSGCRVIVKDRGLLVIASR